MAKKYKEAAAGQTETAVAIPEQQELSVREIQAQRCRERIEGAIHSATVAFYDLSMGLLEAHENEYAQEWGYANFTEYVEKQLDMRARSAYYMVDIAKCVRQIGIPAERVQKIGWTKMKEITNVLTEKPEEAEKYLGMAESLSTSQLKEALGSELKLTEGKEATQAVLRLSLKFEGDSASILNDAISLANADIGREDVNAALSYIAGEWLMARGATAQGSTLENWLEYLERVFAVKLQRVEGEESLDALLVEAAPVEASTEEIAADLDEDDALAELLK